MGLKKTLLQKFLKSTQTEWGNSRWKTLERCPKLYEFVYVQRIFPQGEVWEYKPAAALGSIVHRGLAAHYYGLKKKLKKPFVQEVIEAGREPMALKLRALSLVNAHNLYWAEIGDWETILGIEHELKGEIGPDKTPFTGRADLVVKDGKREVFVDHKTSSKDGDSTREFGMSGQFLGMLNIHGRKKAPRILINKLIKTNVPKFTRDEIHFKESQIAGWRRDICNLDADLDRYFRQGRFPRHYHSCWGRYGLCHYANLCRGGPSMAGLYEVPEGVDIEEVLK